MNTNWEMQLAKSFEDSELTEAVKDISNCHYATENSLTHEQARRIEQLKFLMPETIPPRIHGGRARGHFTKKELWDFVWNFIQVFPLAGASTVEKILLKLEFIQTNQT
jgi:hypothetical protein